MIQARVMFVHCLQNMANMKKCRQRFRDYFSNQPNEENPSELNPTKEPNKIWAAISIVHLSICTFMFRRVYDPPFFEMQNRIRPFFEMRIWIQILPFSVIRIRFQEFLFGFLLWLNYAHLHSVMHAPECMIRI